MGQLLSILNGGNNASANNYFDLSGVLQIQSTKLNEIAANPNGSDVPTQLTNLQTALDNTNANFSSANASSIAVLDHQQKMQSIVKDETDRLNQKKDLMKYTIKSKQRMAELNDSYRKKQEQYVYILIVFMVAFALIIMINRFLPDPFASILAIIVGAIALFLIAGAAYTISSRNQLNFDEVVQPAPAAALVNGHSNANAGITNQSNLLSMASGTCIGNACCTSGQIYDTIGMKCVQNTGTSGQLYVSSAGVFINSDQCGKAGTNYANYVAGDPYNCVPSTSISGFTTISEAYVDKQPTNAQPFSPNEFAEYAPYRL